MRWSGYVKQQRRIRRCGSQRDDALKLPLEKHKAGRVEHLSAEKKAELCREVLDRLRELMMMDPRRTKYTGQVTAAAVLAEILHMKNSAIKEDDFEGWTDEELEQYATKGQRPSR